ncbi:hypothetical protein D082_23540 [Synechocystis sp. PCC 6714]|nr:hypothetical protein D082_23540 [Synechocystis sp. PCC 6714]
MPATLKDSKLDGIENLWLIWRRDSSINCQQGKLPFSSGKTGLTPLW